jgi:hypothetical protein
MVKRRTTSRNPSKHAFSVQLLFVSMLRTCVRADQWLEGAVGSVGPVRQLRFEEQFHYRARRSSELVLHSWR